MTELSENHHREVRLFGDAALTARTRSVHEAHDLARSVTVAAWQGVDDVVVGMQSVTVIYDPRTCDVEELASALAVIDAAPGGRPQPRSVQIPVAFDGPDIDEVAHMSGCTVEEVVVSLTSAELEVAFLGFSPGFAYLTGLPPQLARISRRKTPRTAVPAGAVALAAGYAAVYPTRSPGGWHLVGRTDMVMFDPCTEPFAKLAPGDHVRMVRAELLETTDALTMNRSPRDRLASSSPRRVKIVTAGLLSLVEDRGRRNVASIGVPRAGAADPLALRLANRLVGNPEHAAAIELTGGGPSIRVESGTLHVAVVGDAEPRVDDRPVAPNAVLPVEPGQVLTTGSTRKGLRSYVAFDGGIDSDLLFGSRSSDVLCGLGPGPLREGDLLGLGPSRPVHGRLLQPPSSLRTSRLRVMAGPDPFDVEELRKLTDTTWQATAQADRVGLRLTAEPIVPSTRGIVSRAVVTGAIQVPADGAPIALLCDHATVGGYPVIATVISADLGRLGQLRPGDTVRFDLVDAPIAAAALAELEREVDRGVAGWFPVRAD